MIWNPIERFLWGLATAILILCGLLYFKRSLERDDNKERNYLIGFGIVFISMAITRCIFILADLQIQGHFIDNAFYGDIYASNNSNYWIMIKTGNIIWNICVLIFLFTLPLNSKRIKYTLLTIQFVFLLLIIFTPDQISHEIDSIEVIFFFLVFYINLISLTKKSRLELKGISSILLFGMNIHLIGVIFYSPEIKSLNTAPLILAPLLTLIGSLISIIPMIIKQIYYTNALKFWLVLGITTIVISSFMAFYFIYLGLIVFFILAIISILILIYIFYQAIINIEFEAKSDIEVEHEDMLGIFTRPDKINEEDISLSIEKKICLVCKGKVSRFNSYICECYVLYCEKCAQALSNLENACWVCNAPFDESKPVKEYKNIEEKTDAGFLDMIKKNSKVN